MNVGDPVAAVTASTAGCVRAGVARAGPYRTVRSASPATTTQPLPEGRIGHVQIRGENVTRGYFENPEANAAAFTADGWLRTGDLGVMHEGELYITGRAKEIIFVNGQNYYPHDLESIAQRAPGLELGKVVAAGVRAAAARRSRSSWCSCCIAATWRSSCPWPREVARLINEQTGLEVAHVMPVKRIPKTTSGKIQRHLLEESYVDGEFDAELAELAALRAAQRGSASPTRATQIEDQLQAHLRSRAATASASTSTTTCSRSARARSS